MTADSAGRLHDSRFSVRTVRCNSCSRRNREHPHVATNVRWRQRPAQRHRHHHRRCGALSTAPRPPVRRRQRILLSDHRDKFPTTYAPRLSPAPPLGLTPPPSSAHPIAVGDTSQHTHHAAAPALSSPHHHVILRGSAPVITSPPAAAPPSSDFSSRLLPQLANNLRGHGSRGTGPRSTPPPRQHGTPPRGGFAQLATPPPPTRAAPRPLTSPYGLPSRVPLRSSRPARRERHCGTTFSYTIGCHELADEFSARRYLNRLAFASPIITHPERRGTYNISSCANASAPLKDPRAHRDGRRTMSRWRWLWWRRFLRARRSCSRRVTRAGGYPITLSPATDSACDRSRARDAMPHSRQPQPTTPGHRGGPVNGSGQWLPARRPVIRPHRQTITFAPRQPSHPHQPSPERDHQRGNLPIVSRS